LGTSVSAPIPSSPQWSPVTKTGESHRCHRRWRRTVAAMEFGHEDGEVETPGPNVGLVYDKPQSSPVKTRKAVRCVTVRRRVRGPQWSPVTKTGKTARATLLDRHLARPAMEPGHEDREDGAHQSPASSGRQGRNGEPGQNRETCGPGAS